MQKQQEDRCRKTFTKTFADLAVLPTIQPKFAVVGEQTDFSTRQAPLSPTARKRFANSQTKNTIT